MKLFAFLTAGLVAAAAAPPVPAAAQSHSTRIVVREHDSMRYRDGRHGHWRTRTVCTNQWHHGRNVRRCRTVRYR